MRKIDAALISTGIVLTALAAYGRWSHPMRPRAEVGRGGAGGSAFVAGNGSGASGPSRCVTISGKKGTNGAGDDGGATVCGSGQAIVSGKVVVIVNGRVISEQDIPVTVTATEQ